MPTRPLRLGVLISGAGRTLLNLLDRIATGELPAEIAGVISSRPRGESNDIPFARCEQEHIPLRVIRPADFRSTADFAATQANQLDAWRVDLVAMAGYLKFWPIPDRYLYRVMNIHPSLLPRHGGHGFYGLRVHEAVLAAGDTESGCTVHFVDNQYDHGPIIVQRKVPVMPDDTPDTLAARVFAEECDAYPRAIEWFANDRLDLVPDSTRESGWRVDILPE